MALEHVVPGASNASVEAAYDEFQRDLFTFAIRMAGDRAAAEDAVQTAFLQLLRMRGTGQSPDNVRAWLFRVCANELRSAARRRRVADSWRMWLRRNEESDPPELAVLGRERRDAVALALSRLSLDQRRAFLLSLDGFPGPEIARILGKSDVATRALLFRARTALRDEAAREEGRER